MEYQNASNMNTTANTNNLGGYILCISKTKTIHQNTVTNVCTYPNMDHKHQMFLFSHFVPKTYEFIFYGVFAGTLDPEQEQYEQIEPLI